MIKATPPMTLPTIMPTLCGFDAFPDAFVFVELAALEMRVENGEVVAVCDGDDELDGELGELVLISRVLVTSRRPGPLLDSGAEELLWGRAELPTLAELGRLVGVVGMEIRGAISDSVVNVCVVGVS